MHDGSVGRICPEPSGRLTAEMMCVQMALIDFRDQSFSALRANWPFMHAVAAGSMVSILLATCFLASRRVQ
jgi:hypothetical protein